MKKFAFIIEDLYGGGAQKSLINTAEGLRKRGNDVTVYILRNVIEHRIPPLLKVINLNIVNRATKALSNGFIERCQAHLIRRELDKIQPEVIISCSCDKITRHIKYDNIWFWIKSNMLASRDSLEEKGKAKRKLLKFYDGRKIIACSQGIVDTLIHEVGLNPCEIKAIFNPYERKEFWDMAEEKIVIPPQPYIISVGTYEHRKRHDRLLRAYKMSGISTPLVILGKGKSGEEERIRHLVSELGLENQVIFPGYQLNPYPFIKNARALILTSDGEGLPRVLIEALLLDTPVISVDCPSGPSEILTGSLIPFLVQRDDEEALADAIKKMNENPVVICADHYQPFLAESILPQFEKL